MKQIKLFSGSNLTETQNIVNEFIKEIGKFDKIIDIKFSSTEKTIDIMIIYDEYEGDL